MLISLQPSSHLSPVGPSILPPKAPGKNLSTPLGSRPGGAMQPGVLLHAPPGSIPGYATRRHNNHPTGFCLNQVDQPGGLSHCEACRAHRPGRTPTKAEYALGRRPGTITRQTISSGPCPRGAYPAGRIVDMPPGQATRR
jgi:hypothetical protein